MAEESSFKIKSGYPTIDKDPSATLDYTLDLSLWLQEIQDTVSSATLTATGVTAMSHTIVDGNKIVAWVSGGTVGQAAKLVYQYTTTNGRTDERTIAFNIKER
jgi:hypothetical protein